MKTLKFPETLHRFILLELSSSRLNVEEASCGGSKEPTIATRSSPVPSSSRALAGAGAGKLNESTKAITSKDNTTVHLTGAAKKDGVDEKSLPIRSWLSSTMGSFDGSTKMETQFGDVVVEFEKISKEISDAWGSDLDASELVETKKNATPQELDELEGSHTGLGMIVHRRGYNSSRMKVENCKGIFCTTKDNCCQIVALLAAHIRGKSATFDLAISRPALTWFKMTRTTNHVAVSELKEVKAIGGNQSKARQAVELLLAGLATRFNIQVCVTLFVAMGMMKQGSMLTALRDCITALDWPATLLADIDYNDA